MVQYETIFAIVKISEIELYLGVVIEKPWVKSQAQTFLARNPQHLVLCPTNELKMSSRTPNYS